MARTEFHRRLPTIIVNPVEVTKAQFDTLSAVTDLQQIEISGLDTSSKLLSKEVADLQSQTTSLILQLTADVQDLNRRVLEINRELLTFRGVLHQIAEHVKRLEDVRLPVIQQELKALEQSTEENMGELRGLIRILDEKVDELCGEEEDDESASPQEKGRGRTETSEQKKSK